MDHEIDNRTVRGKLLKWYPLPHQRRADQVKKLRAHMLNCDVCADPRETICPYAGKLVLVADIALGLREVVHG